jgi:hypothetical protein
MAPTNGVNDGPIAPLAMPSNGAIGATHRQWREWLLLVVIPKNW